MPSGCTDNPGDTFEPSSTASRSPGSPELDSALLPPSGEPPLPRCFSLAIGFLCSVSRENPTLVSFFQIGIEAQVDGSRVRDVRCRKFSASSSSESPISPTRGGRDIPMFHSACEKCALSLTFSYFLHHFRTSSAALPRLGRPAVSLSHLLNQNVTTD